MIAMVAGSNPRVSSGGPLSKNLNPQLLPRLADLAFSKIYLALHEKGLLNKYNMRSPTLHISLWKVTN